MTGLADMAFARMRKNAEKMRFERTGLLPARVEDYVNLKNWQKQEFKEHSKSKWIQNVRDLDIAGKQSRELVRVLQGKTSDLVNTGVLGHPTVWARTWEGTEEHPISPWPTAREFREEGDERFTSRYGRFLPIPRLPGNPTVAYKHRKWAPIERLDEVMPVPKLYGTVNVDKSGFFDATVDEDLVPFDDEQLPGNEYFVNQFSGTGQSSSNVGVTKNSNTEPNLRASHHASKAPGHKHTHSQLRAEAVPFVGCYMHEANLVVLGHNSINGVSNNLEKIDNSWKDDSEALMDSTNLADKPGSLGCIGIERKRRIMADALAKGTHLKESYLDNALMTGEPETSTTHAAGEAGQRSVSPFQKSPDFLTLTPVSIKREMSSSHLSDLFDETENIAPSLNPPSDLSDRQPTSFSSKYRANRPAGLNLHGGSSFMSP